MLDQRNPAPDYENDEAAAEDDGYSSSWENAGLEDDSVTGDDMPDGTDELSDSDAVPEEDQGGEAEAASDEAEAAPEETEMSDGMESSDDAPAEESAEASGADGSWGDSNDAAESDAEEPTEEAELESEPESEDTGPRFVANSRPEAIDLMNKVLMFYRVAEPSSPVSLIIERALELSSKNFIELLGNVLPEGSLKVKPSEESSSGGW